MLFMSSLFGGQDISACRAALSIWECFFITPKTSMDCSRIKSYNKHVAAVSRKNPSLGGWQKKKYHFM